MYDLGVFYPKKLKQKMISVERLKVWYVYQSVTRNEIVHVWEPQYLYTWMLELIEYETAFIYVFYEMT